MSKINAHKGVGKGRLRENKIVASFYNSYKKSLDGSGAFFTKSEKRCKGVLGISGESAFYGIGITRKGVLASQCS